ncbi:MAG TPA: vWA domain-containing protein [Thermodesulfobacteriota bacterium]|nr:vWA domain-containing protein [Thermodesulfobacteriota bacterium]
MEIKFKVGYIRTVLFLVSILVLESYSFGKTVEVPKPLDVFLAIDQSGSMKNTDPENVRLGAALYFVDFLASQRTDFFDHRAGIINFGDRPPANPEDETVPLTSVEDKNLNRIKSVLKPMNLGDTSFISALQKAEGTFKKAGDLTNRQKAIVFFTDGEPDDKRKLTLEKYFDEIHSFINKSLSDCLIYVVAVDVKDAFWERDKKYWDQITSNNTYKLSQIDETELKKVFSSILLRLLRVPEIKWDTVPPEGLSVEIEPYLERATFSILKESPDVKLVIMRENGERISETDQNVEYKPGKLWEIFSITDPEPGVWKYKIEKGKGKVEVGKAIIPVEVKLISPYSPYPQGKSMKVRASFLKRDGSPVKEHPAYRLWLGAKLINPEGEKILINFRTEGNGIYIGDKIISTNRSGDYLIPLTMKGGNLIISRRELTISVEPIPYLTVVKPKEGSEIALRDDIEIEANLMRGGRPVAPSEVFTDDPNSLVWTQIADLEGKMTKSVSLKQVGKKGVFSGAFSSSEFHKEGNYKLLFQLSGTRRAGMFFKAVPEEVEFTKRMDIIDFLLYRWYLVGIFVLFLLLVLDWAQIGRQNEWWLWRFGSPKLSGQIDLHNPDGETATYYLSGRKVDIGKNCRVPLNDPEVRGKCGFIVAVWRKTEEGYRIPTPKIYYSSSLDSKGYDELRELEDGDSVTIADRYTLEYRR